MTDLEDIVEGSPNLARRTKDLYLYCIRDFLHFAGAAPDGWRLRAVEKWLRGLLERGLKPQTVRVYRKALRFASTGYARLEEDPSRDFAHLASKIKVTRGAEREPVTYQEQLLLLTTCNDNSPKSLRDRALLVLAFRTGLRREGMHALDIEGIQPPKVTTINKGGDSLTFEPDAEVFAVLQPWLELLQDRGITTGAVFRDIRGDKILDRMSAFQIWYVFRRRGRTAGVERSIFPHLARHSLVTSLREEGVTPLEIRGLTGQTEQTIQQHYTHVKSKGAVGSKLPSLLNPKRNK